MATIEELQRQVAELTRAKKAAETLAAHEKCGRESAEARVAPTCFLDYIWGVDQHLSPALSLLGDPSKQSTADAAAAVEGKFYPQRFRRWTEFGAKHEETFFMFAGTFANKAPFPSLFSLEDGGRERRPDCFEESDLCFALRAAIEEPAVTVVNRYLKITNDPTCLGVRFQNNECKFQLDPEESLTADDDPSPQEQPSSSQTVDLPDRWLVARRRDGLLVPAFVREYTTGQIHLRLRNWDALMMWQREDFFQKVSEATATGGGAADEVFRATAVCRAYHGMLTLGLEFGYVAARDGLMFLRVPEDDPGTLYYFDITFPNNPNAYYHRAARLPTAMDMSYLATLCLCAIRSTARPRSWIQARDSDVKRWPKPKEMPPPPAHDDAGSGQGPSGSASTTGAQPNALKRPSDATEAAQPNKRPAWLFIEEPPTLPYCTQACLRGLCDRRPLDDKCPNVALHRAARTTAGNGDTGDDGHPLTADVVLARIGAQLAANMGKDCQCLQLYGCYGRHGVLFKLAVTGFGYTFVGKGVQSAHRDILINEAACYAALAAFQGKLMPVYLGRVKLEHAIQLPNRRVRYMMLMSYAGRDLSKVLPPGIDWRAEKARTLSELEAAGLWPDEVRRPNLVWNMEVRRVMRIDFGVAGMTRRAEPACGVQDDQTKGAAGDGRNEQTEAAAVVGQTDQTEAAAAVVQDDGIEGEAAGQVEAGEADAVAPAPAPAMQATPAPPGSPLATKTDANEHNDDKQQ